MTDSVAQDQLQSYFRRWRSLEERRGDVVEDLRQFFVETKGDGYDGKALRIAFRQVLDAEDAVKANDIAERDAMVDLYVAAIVGTPVATRAGRAREAAENDTPIQQSPTAEATESDHVEHTDSVATQSQAKASEGKADITGIELASDSDVIRLSAGRTADLDRDAGHTPTWPLTPADDVAVETNLPETANEQPEAHGSSPCDGAGEAHRPATYGQLVTGGESAATQSPAPEQPQQQRQSYVLPTPKPLRPYCKEIGTGKPCGGQGRKHCFTCRSAAEAAGKEAV